MVQTYTNGGINGGTNEGAVPEKSKTGKKKPTKTDMGEQWRQQTPGRE